MEPQLLAESGILLVDKPAGWTSHDVVGFVRRFGIKKVGHCGTLDPAATGLLILLLGKATKLSDRFMGQDKVYEGTMRLGTETFSQDAEGAVTGEFPYAHVTEELLRQTLPRFVGEQMQVPPMVSAKKQDGRRLYKIARRGEEVEREPRPITIYSLELQRFALPDADFVVKCSKGTYVRTLCADLGRALGSGAHLAALRRLASGRFHVRDAHGMDEIKTWNRATLLQHALPLVQVLDYV